MRVPFVSRTLPALVAPLMVAATVLPFAAPTRAAVSSIPLAINGSTQTVSVIAGQSVSVSACGFVANTLVTIKLLNAGSPGVVVSSAAGVLVAASTGCIFGNFTVPSLAGNNYLVQAVDASSDAAYGAIALSPATPLTVTSSGSNVVTVSGFIPGYSGSVFITTSSVATPGTIVPQPAATATSGLFSSAVTLPSTAGYYFVVVQPLNGSGAAYVGIASASGSTTIGAGSLTLSPPSAQPGAAITAYACGISSPVSLSLTLTSSSYTTAIAPTSQVAIGGVSGCYNVAFTVPSSVPTGTYTVTLSNSGVAVASGQLILAANGTLSPNPTTSGTTETGTVCGLISGDGLNVQFVNNATGVVANSVSLGAGSLTFQGSNCYSFSFALPQLASATYTATLRGTLSNYTVTSQITVGAASLSASPITVTAGQTTTLQGASFAPSATVTLSGLGPNVTLTSTTAGTFSTSFAVPAGTARGTYTIKATDTSNGTASVTLSVVPAVVTVTVSAASGTPSQQVTVSGSGYAANEQVAVSLSPTVSQPFVLGGTTQTFQAGATGNFSGVYTVPSVGSGNYILLAQGQTSHAQAVTTFAVAAPVAPTATLVPVIPTSTPVSSLPLPSVGTTATTTYFADGYTGTAASNGKATFSERIYLFNPSSVASTVTMTYAVYNAATNTRTTMTEQNVVPPATTVIRDVNADVGNDRQVSAKVQATSGIVAEVVISRVSSTGAVLDASANRGTSQPGTSWYFAEGYTGASLQEYLTLYNPGATEASAQIQYLPSDGTVVAPQTVQVPANGQVTVNVRAQYNGLVRHGSKNVAAQVSSDQPIVVDRAMYWGDGSGSGKFGSDLEPGIASASQTQYFAYLPTSNGSQAFVTVLNPGTAATGVTLRLLDRAGGTLRTATAQVAAKQRYTFVVPNLLSGSFGPVVGGLVSSGAPVVAEAGDYFGGSPNIGLHSGLMVQGSAGAQIGARASISTRGAVLQVYNPTGTPLRVQVRLGGSGGLSVVFDNTLAAGATRLINLPPGSSARSVLVLGSNTFSAAVVSGGVGNSQTWGGTLG